MRGGYARTQTVAYRLPIYILLFISGLALLLPIAWMLSVSFRTNVEVLRIPPRWLPDKFSLISYTKVLGNLQYLRCFWNSYLVAILVTVFALFFGSLAGYGLARFSFRGKKLLVMFLLITQTFPLVLLSLPYFVVIVNLGLYDNLISLILVYLSFCLPFCILMLRNYFRDLPTELEEAAMVDGCTRLGALWRVTIRLSVPAMIGTGLYTFLLAWNEFLFAMILVESWSNRVLTIAIYSLLSEFVTDWTTMMAFSMLASLPIMIAFIFLQKYVIKGMTMGAIK
jgi:multiple sugar transport system permease protein